MTWFETLTGIEECTPQEVRARLSVDEDALVCPDGTRLVFGSLETPTLAELRSSVRERMSDTGQLRVAERIADIRELHSDMRNANAVFQVASQFNLLEMTGPSVTPERGVGIYEQDHTQGPACAISCGAGTIYRNYFVPVGDQIGQSAERQIDCSADLGMLLGNREGELWKMRNGYLLSVDNGLQRVASKIRAADEDELDRYRVSLRIGLQRNTSVTRPGATHCVSQAYCSALPVAYGHQPTEQWSEFARLVLEAAYEATFCAAILNANSTGSNKLFLTLLGGGAFGNRDSWIIDAIERAIVIYRAHDLDVVIVSHRSPKACVAELIERLQLGF